MTTKRSVLRMHAERLKQAQLEITARTCEQQFCSSRADDAASVHRIAPFTVSVWYGHNEAEVSERFENLEEAVRFFEQCCCADSSVVLWAGDRRVRYSGTSPECNPIQPRTAWLLLHAYGASYFGSGGAHGCVHCSPNCRPTGEVDNGFLRSPERVVITDPTRPARFYARGGDCIGGGREWAEAAVWDIDLQAWRPAEVVPDARRDWLAAADA